MNTLEQDIAELRNIRDAVKVYFPQQKVAEKALSVIERLQEKINRQEEKYKQLQVCLEANQDYGQYLHGVLQKEEDDYGDVTGSLGKRLSIAIACLKRFASTGHVDAISTLKELENNDK